MTSGLARANWARRRRGGLCFDSAYGYPVDFTAATGKSDRDLPWHAELRSFTTTNDGNGGRRGAPQRIPGNT